MHISVDAPHLPWLAALHDNAVATLDRNVVTDQRGTFIRAGAGYPDPWTRDAALNSWGAANLLRPAAARDTLVRVCEDGPDGGRIIAQDDQWWDQIVWVIAAHDHALWTGDRAFLAEAFAIGTASLAILDAARFRPRWGLYAGPALMQDGISGLPTPPATPTETSSFVLDYPDAHEVMSLSTNLVYVAALRSLDAMGTELGGSAAVAAAAGFGMRADELVAAVREHLGDGHTFGYFRHGSDAGSDADGIAGTLDTHREAAGLALAALFGAATDPHAALRSIARGPFGPVNVGPHFPDRYDDERPGRHNAMCWPMVMGLVGSAAASLADHDGTVRALTEFHELVERSDGRFDELYDPISGEAHGGWQCGDTWPSEPDQTWSATSFLRLVHTGLVGANAGFGGLRFEPVPLAAGERVTVRGLPYRDAVLDVEIVPGPAASVRLDDADVPTDGRPHIDSALTGRHTVHVTTPTAA